MTEQVSIVNCVDNMMRNVKEFPFHLLDEMSDELKAKDKVIEAKNDEIQQLKERLLRLDPQFKS